MEGCWLKTCFSAFQCSFYDHLCQCVSGPGLIVQDSLTTSAGLLLGLTKHPDLSCKPGTLVAVFAGFRVLVGTHILTKTDMMSQCQGV